MRQLLIIGLGNPGKEYILTRHNVGFMAVNRLARKLKLPKWIRENHSLLTRGEYLGNDILLAKPRTFMNLSGNAALALCSRFRIPPLNVLVIIDDMALPFGKIRFRACGSDGGHNGLHSIIEKLGRCDFPRLRIGIGNPPEEVNGADYVLSNFTPEQLKQLEEIFAVAMDGILSFIESGIEETMNHFN